MRTKHIFYSMALVVALGSCTADEFSTTMQNNKQDLSVRPLLGDIELVTDGAQTRFALNEDNEEAAQPVFVDGDQLGAAIIDVPNYTVADGDYDEDNKIANYNIVEYYSSNNAFTLNNGVWTVDLPMVEGNYLFYAPYNRYMEQRTPLAVKLPVKQDASGERTALQEFYKSGSVVRVGYQFLAANDGEVQRPVVTMNDVFAYPKFTIKNSAIGYTRPNGETAATAFTGGTIKLDSMQVSQVKDDGSVAIQSVVCGGVLKHAGTKQTGATADEGVVGLMKTGGEWTNSPMANYTAQLLANDGQITTPGRGEDNEGVITTFDFGGKELTGDYTFYGVLPAMTYTDATNSMRVTLFVTIGDKHYMIEQATVDRGNVSDAKGGILLNSSVGTINLIKGQKYPQEELNFERDGQGLYAKPSAGDILTIDLSGMLATELPEEAQVELIENNEQFIQFFRDQLNGSALVEDNGVEEIDNTQPAYAFADDHTVVINSALIDALSTYNNRGTLTISSALPIDEDVTIKGVDDNEVTFVSAAGNEYTVTLTTTDNSGEYIITNSGVTSINIADNERTVIVNYNATLSANNGTIKTLYVMGEKTLTVGAAISDGIESIINYGSITASYALTATSFINNGDITVAAAIAAPIENNGQITINNDNAVVQVASGDGVVDIAKANIEAVKDNVSFVGQTVYYSTSGAINDEAIAEAEEYGFINAIKGTTATLDTDAIAALEDIKTISVNSNITSSVSGSLNFEGLTLEVTANASWSGSVGTTVNNVNIVLADNVTLTLTNISINGTVTKGEGANLVTGSNASWNGASGN